MNNSFLLICRGDAGISPYCLYYFFLLPFFFG